jgi:hypothetical protein
LDARDVLPRSGKEGRAGEETGAVELTARGHPVASSGVPTDPGS